MTFYKCDTCGEIVMEIEKGTCTPSCCGKEMRELKANTVDAAAEKHVPVVEKDNGKVCVKVGSVAHPMTEEHSIRFIVLEEEGSFQVRKLTPADKPEAEFAANGKAVAAYEYCNLHGLWKKDC